MEGFFQKFSFLRVKQKPRCSTGARVKKEKFSHVEKRDWFCAGEWVFTFPQWLFFNQTHPFLFGISRVRLARLMVAEISLDLGICAGKEQEPGAIRVSLVPPELWDFVQLLRVKFKMCFSTCILEIV